MIDRTARVLGVLSLAALAHAGPVATPAEMDAFLDDQLYFEDFEGFSVHGGTTVTAPNPLSDANAPEAWGILAGVTYLGAPTLRLHGGYLDGDDSNILQGGTDMLVTFDEPQKGVGLRVVDGTGNVPYHDIVTFYHDADVLGVLVFDLPAPGDAFAGWTDVVRGITSVRITSTGTGFSGLSAIDNVQFGAVVTPPACPCDWNADGNLNDQDFFDWANDYFTQTGPHAEFDFNADGFQNDQDFFDFANCFFTPPGAC